LTFKFVEVAFEWGWHLCIDFADATEKLEYLEVGCIEFSSKLFQLGAFQTMNKEVHGADDTQQSSQVVR